MIVDVAVLLAVVVAEAEDVELGDSVPFAEALKEELPVDVAERVLLCVARADPDSVGVVVPEREADPELVDDFEAVRVLGPLGDAVVLAEPVCEAEVVCVCFCETLGWDVPEAVRVDVIVRVADGELVDDILTNDDTVCVTVPTDVTVWRGVLDAEADEVAERVEVRLPEILAFALHVDVFVGSFVEAAEAVDERVRVTVGVPV